jgi:hypothetical protein
MAIKHSKVDVGTTAVSLTAGVSETDNTYGRSLVATNEGAATVYVGGSDVTTTSYGYPLVAGGELALDVAGSDEPFAIAASGTVTLRLLHLGV